MPEEITQLPVSEQEVQIQPPSFLDKIKIHKFKILGGILGILVFAGAVFGAYKLGQNQPQVGSQPTPGLVATPTPNPTADWETYTNEKYGYSIKYPQEWKIEETGSISWKSVDYKLSETGNIISGQEILLFVDSNPTKRSIENWWGTENTDYIVTDQISFKIDGYDSVKYNLSAPGGAVYGALISNFNKVLRFEVYAVENNISNTIQTFNLMLSTFKFLGEKTEGEKVFCKEPRPEVCTMECIANPPYICGSNGKSYCSVCQACADPEVEWYVIQDKPCGI